MKNILILGGAGFIGSNIVKLFVEKKYNVTVIDGLLKNSGGDIDNISKWLDKINFIDKRIEDVDDLSIILNNNEIIVDSMAWTCHLSAIKDPFFDLELNVKSHLYLLEQIKKYDIHPDKIIYLGSRSQYGNPSRLEIDENTSMTPLDIQGIHKLTAENYYRIFSEIHNLNIISLRMVGVFGNNQPFNRKDLGLVGNLIREGIQNREITIYGKERKREILYVEDLVDTVFLLSQKEIYGFNPFNVGGHIISIEGIGEKIIDVIGSGRISYQDLPKEIENIDVKNYLYNCSKIKSIIGEARLSDLNKSFRTTIKYFQYKLAAIK